LKSSFDILDRVYKLLNVTQITSLITGGVWRRLAKNTSNGKYITINTIPQNAGDYPLQEGVVIVNAYARDHEDGTPDESSLRSMSDAVMTLIEAHNATSEYFALSVSSDNIYPDDSNPGVSYLSLRVNYIIEK